MRLAKLPKTDTNTKKSRHVGTSPSESTEYLDRKYRKANLKARFYKKSRNNKN